MMRSIKDYLKRTTPVRLSLSEWVVQYISRIMLTVRASLGFLVILAPGQFHDDVIKWKHFPRDLPFVRGIYRSPVDSSRKGQWRAALMFLLICAGTNGGANNRDVGDFRRHRTHYDVIVMYPYHTGLCQNTGLIIRSVPVPVEWWRHQMEAFSASLAICAGKSPVTGEFPAQRPVTRSVDVFFDMRPNIRLNKQLWCWWFETSSRPLWRYCNGATAVTNCNYQDHVWTGTFPSLYRIHIRNTIWISIGDH